MVTNTLVNFNAKRALYVFIAIHVLAWTLAPAFIRYNLPLDSIEGAAWGRQLAWGYDKNPFLSAWLTELAIQMPGGPDWAVYLLSQLSVAIAFFTVFQIGKKMMPAYYALAAVLILEGIQYYNIHAIDFSDNALELGVWGLTLFFFYEALSKKKTRDWILTGFFAGLGMMTKYYTLMLLIPMVFMLILNRNARENLKSLPLYAGVLTFFVIITPHIIWLITHQFTTLQYAFDRVSVPHPSWINHVRFPLQFTLEQFETLLPALVLLSLLFMRKQPRTILAVSLFNKDFLFYTALCPFLLTVLLSALTGMQLRAAWGQPLFSLWGIGLILLLQPRLTLRKLYVFFAIWGAALALAITIYCVMNLQPSKLSSAIFPGKRISTELTEHWHKKYHTSLPTIAGSRWLAGNISVYSKDRPAVYIDWNKKISPWINENSLKTKGGIFVWNITERKKHPEVPFHEIKARYPMLSEPEIRHFTWHRNTKKEPLEIMVAFLPPNSNS